LRSSWSRCCAFVIDVEEDNGKAEEYGQELVECEVRVLCRQHLRAKLVTV
jgi:hypothetical protein